MAPQEIFNTAEEATSVDPATLDLRPGVTDSELAEMYAGYEEDDWHAEHAAELSPERPFDGYDYLLSTLR